MPNHTHTPLPIQNNLSYKYNDFDVCSDEMYGKNYGEQAAV